MTRLEALDILNSTEPDLTLFQEALTVWNHYVDLSKPHEPCEDDCLELERRLKIRNVNQMRE